MRPAKKSNLAEEEDESKQQRRRRLDIFPNTLHFHQAGLKIVLSDQKTQERERERAYGKSWSSPEISNIYTVGAAYYEQLATFVISIC